ncbi:hypothetical protein EDD21DRAFT_418120 [Dissophora ornata]|nr:hypothetical protein EDD21DRAFT_418120 [Dissophora ornata]
MSPLPLFKPIGRFPHLPLSHQHCCFRSSVHLPSLRHKIAFTLYNSPDKIAFTLYSFTDNKNVAAIPAVVVQDSPPPPPKESSGSNIQVGDNYSVPTKSKSNSDNNSDNNDDNNNDSNNDNCIIISDTDSCDEYFTEDISEEALLDLDEYFDVDNHEHGRTAFAVKSHTSKEILPNQAGVESMEQNGPDVSEYSDVIHDDTEESPVPGSDEWIELQCPGLLVNGVVNRNVSRYMDQSVMLRIVKELRGLPKAQREPKVFSGIFCPKTYLNNIRCIAEVSKKGDICEFHHFCSSVGFKIGYSGQLVDRIISMHNSHCKVKILPLSTFPKLTGHDNRLCFVYLLEKIMHTIFVANQYDVSCEHRNPWRDRTTHTEFFWFKAVPGDNAPYERTKYEILKLIENIATPWMEVLMDLEHKFYGRLRGLGDELVDAIQVSLVMYLDITRIEQWLPNPSSPPTDHKPEKDLDKWWTEALT